jgi:hypothetical protein
MQICHFPFISLISTHRRMAAEAFAPDYDHGQSRSSNSKLGCEPRICYASFARRSRPCLRRTALASEVAHLSLATMERTSFLHLQPQLWNIFSLARSAPQNVHLAELLLDHLNPLCAEGMSGSLSRAYQRRPSNIRHRHDRDRQSVAGAIVELLDLFLKNPNQFSA